MKKPIVRIAPSPTGKMHIGTARTALFNYLFARSQKGKFLLRMEDTDKKRSTLKHEKDIIKGLKWLGLKWDGKIERQMQRLKIYQKYAQKLLKEKKAYLCFCSQIELDKERQEQLKRKQPPRYSGKCRDLSKKEIEKFKKQGSKPTIRQRVPDDRGVIKFKDLIRDEIKENAGLIADFVLMKSDGIPVFFFAGVIDDYLQNITHVIRGQDHISNTPRQILMIEALGLLIPSYAHIPLILAPDRSKLSKRHGALSTLEYRQMGYLSEAIINFLALLGWHPKDDRELFSLNDLIKEFELERVQKGGAVFDITKLDWLNREYIKILPHDLLFSKIKEELLDVPNSQAERLLPIILERINKWGDIITIKEELKFFWQFPDYDPQKLIWKEGTKEKTLEALMKVKENLAALDSFDEKSIKNSIWLFAETKGKGAVLWPMRYALSGRDKSPDPILIASVLGQKETLQRLQIAIEALTR